MSHLACMQAQSYLFILAKMGTSSNMPNFNFNLFATRLRGYLCSPNWLLVKTCSKRDLFFTVEICINSTTGDGREYRGQLNYTEKGVLCQPWNERWPHDPEETKKLRNPTREGLGKHNYCRNPRGKRARPWCYTTLKRPVWQYCDIVVCNQTLKIREEDTWNEHHRWLRW